MQRTVSLESLSPPVELDPVNTKRGKVLVARDDLLLGGTKQRAIAPFLRDQAAKGFEEFVYGSPPPGFAQVALASTCQQMGLTATIFCDDMDHEGIPSATLHEFSRLAHSFGAKIYTVPHLHQAERLADEYAAEEPTRRQRVPLGFAVEEFTLYLRAEIEKQWQRILGYIGGTPKAMWIPVGSATLGNVFRDVLPDEVTLRAVNVRVLPDEDERLVAFAKRPNVVMYKTPERFADPCELAAPVPSNLYYDSKLWRFLKDEADDHDVWWNVAR